MRTQFYAPLDRLLSQTESVLFSAVSGERLDFEETLTVAHIAAFEDFYLECLINP